MNVTFVRADEVRTGTRPRYCAVLFKRGREPLPVFTAFVYLMYSQATLVDPWVHHMIFPSKGAGFDQMDYTELTKRYEAGQWDAAILWRPTSYSANQASARTANNFGVARVRMYRRFTRAINQQYAGKA